MSSFKCQFHGCEEVCDYPQTYGGSSSGLFGDSVTEIAYLCTYHDSVIKRDLYRSPEGRALKEASTKAQLYSEALAGGQTTLTEAMKVHEEKALVEDKADGFIKQWIKKNCDPELTPKWSSE